jgi:hypothetical protein
MYVAWSVKDIFGWWVEVSWFNLSLSHLFCDTCCSYARLLLCYFSDTLRLLGCAGCGRRHCEIYVSGYYIYLVYRVQVTVPFCCGKHPLHPRICLLFPSILIPSWIWFFSFLQRDPNDIALVQRHLLLACWRHFLLRFLLCSSAVCMSVMPRHFSVHRILLLLLMLVVCTLIGSFLWIAFPARPSFQWNRWGNLLNQDRGVPVRCSCKIFIAVTLVPSSILTDWT